jgi:hypothetical protein
LGALGLPELLDQVDEPVGDVRIEYVVVDALQVFVDLLIHFGFGPFCWHVPVVTTFLEQGWNQP